ncbi:MAG: universal stress protein [Burkholderiales bacterium]
MYKHLLLPTDGSALSEQAVIHGIEFARSISARVTGLYVIPQPAFNATENWVHGDQDFHRHLDKIFKKQAAQYLAFIDKQAKQARVKCDCESVAGSSPYEGILKTAKARSCDLIYMASHGEAGSAAILMGSETQKVLTHSPIPVLVHR